MIKTVQTNNMHLHEIKWTMTWNEIWAYSYESRESWYSSNCEPDVLQNTFSKKKVKKAISFIAFYFCFFRGRWHGDIMIHTVKKTAKIDFEEFLKEVSIKDRIS
jgi:hypothetical protein